MMLGSVWLLSKFGPGILQIFWRRTFGFLFDPPGVDFVAQLYQKPNLHTTLL
jgi:hypothetical protein